MHFKKYKSILGANNGVNIFRGCTHGCIYCDSRSDCYGMGHDFEDVEVKLDAPQQLEGELRRRRARCMIGTGAMCDPYIPAEAQLRYTRRCFESIERLGFGLAVQTKSELIMRDIDLLCDINIRAKCVVQMTLTTFDEAVCRTVEPGVCGSARRAEVLCAMRERGIPTVVWLCPLLPFINDTAENMRGILKLCADAGVRGVIFFGAGLTLRAGNREYYYAALERHFPGLKQEYERRYGLRYEIASAHSAELNAFFYSECARLGMLSDPQKIFAYLREFPQNSVQTSLFSPPQ